MFNLVKFDYFLPVFSEAGQVGCTMVKKLFPNWMSFKGFYYKKAAVVSNFCLIGKFSHNFLVPRMIELNRKTFMPIQTLDLHRVIKFHSNRLYHKQIKNLSQICRFKAIKICNQPTFLFC